MTNFHDGFWAVKITDVVITATTVVLAMLTALQLLIFIASRKDAILTNRAFVFITKIDVEVMVLSNGEIEEFIFSPVWTNSGNTQTTNLEFNHFKGVLGANEPQVLRPEKGKALKERHLLGPASTCLGPAVSFSRSEMFEAYKSAQDGSFGKRTFVFGFSTYNDLYSRTARRTEFCIEIVPVTIPLAVPVRFSLLAHGHHNRADKECKDELNWLDKNDKGHRKEQVLAFSPTSFVKSRTT